MPLYDYRCTECDREVEVMHGINDSGPQQCEHCGGAMRKALSPPAIHFKGSGWAKKDAATATAKPKSGSAADKGPAKSGATSSTGDAATGDTVATSSATKRTQSEAAPAAGSKTD